MNWLVPVVALLVGGAAGGLSGAFALGAAAIAWLVWLRASELATRLQALDDAYSTSQPQTSEQLLRLQRRVQELERGTIAPESEQAQSEMVATEPSATPPQPLRSPSAASSAGVSEPLPASQETDEPDAAGADAAGAETTGAETTGAPPAQAVPPSPSPSEAPPLAATATPASLPPDPAFEGRLRAWLIGDNPLARVGIFVLLVGVVLLLRLAAEHQLLPIEARLGGAALLGMALTVFGFKQRLLRPSLSQLLQGGGVATLYFVVFFGYRVFGLLPPTLTFSLLVVVAVASGVLALLQNSLALVFVGTVGGFAAPILASSGDGDHVALFSYYLGLNLLVLGVAWFKDWKVLSITGFVATFGAGTAWGVLRYEPAHFASTEPFLIAFFLVYVAINVLTALKRPDSLRGGISGSLTFGLPLVCIALQSSLAAERDWVVAVSALAMSALYYALARRLRERHPDASRMLTDGYIALSLGLATLAVPYAIDSKAMVSATWTLEAAGLHWVGLRGRRGLARAASLGLLFVGLGSAAAAGVWNGLDGNAISVLNPNTLCALLLVGAAVSMAVGCLRAGDWLDSFERHGTQWLLPLSAVVWTVALGNEVEHVVSASMTPLIWLTAAALSAAAFAHLGRGLDLMAARWTGLALLPAATVLLLTHVHGAAIWAQGGALAWPVVAICLALVIHAQGTRRESPVQAAHTLFPLWLLLAVGLLLHDVTHDAWQVAAGWADAAVCLYLACGLLALKRLRTNRHPLAVSFDAEHRVATDIAALALLTAMIWGLGRAGSPAPLSFVPLLNPLELALIAGWFVLHRYSADLDARLPVASRQAYHQSRLWGLCGLVFAGLSTSVARCVSHVADSPYTLSSVWHLDAFQVGISILWALVGVGATWWASRQAQRSVWVAAASLLGVVVLKLFSVDLAHLGQVARIVSFVGVGGLLLGVGYLAPLPPAARATRSGVQAA